MNIRRQTAHETSWPYLPVLFEFKATKKLLAGADYMIALWIEFHARPENPYPDSIQRTLTAPLK